METRDLTVGYKAVCVCLGVFTAINKTMHVELERVRVRVTTAVVIIVIQVTLRNLLYDGIATREIAVNVDCSKRSATEIIATLHCVVCAENTLSLYITHARGCAWESVGS